MRWFKKNEGVTLVELMVTIAIGSIITLAVTTVLLLGFRINARTTDAVSQQYTARVVLSMLEQLTTEGSIAKVQSDPDAWKIFSKEEGAGEKVMASYDSKTGIIYSGDFESPGAVSLLEGVMASHITMEGKLLSFALETEEGSFSTSAYCRTAKPEATTDDDTGSSVVGNLTDDDTTNDSISGLNGTNADIDGRKTFLKVLSSQSGGRGGIILNSQQYDGGKYKFFSEWYVGGYDSGSESKGWSYNTPWCGCFISWGLTHMGQDIQTPAGRSKWYANVDEFMEYFQLTNSWNVQTQTGYTPVPGDLIFFNFISSDRNDPSHMGAVLSVEGGYVYTIEGNSADMVAVRRYALNDQRILGYGVLQWTSNNGA